MGEDENGILLLEGIRTGNLNNEVTLLWEYT